MSSLTSPSSTMGQQTVAFDVTQQPAAQAAIEPLWLHPAARRLNITMTRSTAVLSDGRLLMVQDGCVCTSSDDGVTWQRRPFQGHAASAKGWEDPLIRCASGTLVLVYHDSSTAKLEWDNERHELKSPPRLEVWSTRSSDEGRTWSQPVQLYGGYCGSMVNAIQTRRGRIVVPVMCMLTDPGRHAQMTCVSDDEGQTWQRSNIIDIGGHGHHDGGFEAAVAELSDGRLWMVLRTNLERMWQAFSDDQGLSWRTVLPTDIDASSSPANLLRLGSGRLMMAWNRLYPEGLSEQEKAAWERAGGDLNICRPLSSWHRRELSVALSEDDGRTWSGPMVLMRGKQCSYPMLLERKPGEIWVATCFGPRFVAAVCEQGLIDHAPRQRFARNTESLRNTP